MPGLLGAVRVSAARAQTLVKASVRTTEAVVRGYVDPLVQTRGFAEPASAQGTGINGELTRLVGSGKILKDGKSRPLDVKAGDKILFGKYAGTEVKLDGEEYVLLREDDILAVVG